MRSLKKSPIIAAAWLLSGVTSAGPGVSFESSPAQVHLLELFSSEGCSSCPPADAYLVSLRGDAGLWKKFVPVAFHVDYWDGLGWPDRYASAEHTARQRSYATAWGNGRVYTPAFVLDGREVGPRQGTSLVASGAVVGKLTARGDAEKFSVTYVPQIPGERWVAHAVLLGNGIVTRVGSGENARSQLRHEFVALKSVSGPMKKTPSGFAAEIVLSKSAAEAATSYSVAFWVTREGNQTPVQAVGGDLSREGR